MRPRVEERSERPDLHERSAHPDPSAQRAQRPGDSFDDLRRFLGDYRAQVLDRL